MAGQAGSAEVVAGRSIAGRGGSHAADLLRDNGGGAGAAGSVLGSGETGRRRGGTRGLGGTPFAVQSGSRACGSGGGVRQRVPRW